MQVIKIILTVMFLFFSFCSVTGGFNHLSKCAKGDELKGVLLTITGLLEAVVVFAMWIKF